MGVVSFQMKTHSRNDITEQFDILNPCVVHGKKPRIVHTVAGRKKYDFYCAICDHDDCGKIGESGQNVVDVWNKWNPRL